MWTSGNRHFPFVTCYMCRVSIQIKYNLCCLVFLEGSSVVVVAISSTLSFPSTHLIFPPLLISIVNSMEKVRIY